MAHDKKKMYESALKKAKDSGVYFIEEVADLVGISRTTFYEYFPLESDKMNAIKEVLIQNKSKDKAKIRDKLMASDKAAELLPLYKLIATSEERKKLSSSFIDLTSDGKTLNSSTSVQVNFFKTEEEE